MRMAYLEYKGSAHDAWKVTKQLIKQYPELVILVPQLIVEPFKEGLQILNEFDWEFLLKEKASVLLVGSGKIIYKIDLVNHQTERIEVE